MKSIFFFAFLIINCASKEFPSYIEKCSISDPSKIGDCIMDRIKKVKPRLVDGIPEFNIPSIDPLRLPKLAIETGKGTNVEFKADLFDIDIKGLLNFEVTKFVWGIDNNMMEIDVKFPFTNVVGKYQIKGKILLFDLQSTGPFVGNLTNVEASSKIGVKIVKKNEKNYLEISEDDISVTNKFSAASVYFDKLFENEEINNQVNALINENIVELAKEVSPLIHAAVHKAVTLMLHSIFNDFSLEELFDK